ncbi:MAG: DUF5661 family protein [Thermomicrobiales bacterium]
MGKVSTGSFTVIARQDVDANMETRHEREGLVMSGTKRTTTDEAKRIGDSIGVDWTTYELEEFRRGMDVEFEHGSHDPQTDVTHDDPIITGKIAFAHMKEFPDYYTRLDKMEEDAERDWAVRRSAAEE